MNQSLGSQEPSGANSGWRRQSREPSLQEVFRTVPIPVTRSGWFGFFRKLLAFTGPGYLIAVGYMDPGNWATDLAGGSQFYYTLLSVVIISQSDGHLPAAFGAQAGGGQQARSGASLPRPFSSGIQRYSLDRLRDRH